MRTILKFEFTDWTLDHPDYFQGHGVAFTEFDECYTGIGNSPLEAAEDAIEQCAYAGEGWPSELANEADEAVEAFSGQGDELAEDDERRYFVSIRVKYEESGQ